jgi:predicted nucleic acid-binding protein
MPFTAVYDACVLYPASLRDLLIRLAQTGLFRARWTNEILDECFRNIAAKRPEVKLEALERTRDLMNRAIRDVLIDGYQTLISGLDLPDPGDRHVLAAAIRCGAEVIVTINLRDFPADELEPYQIEAQHPDEFVLNLIDLDPIAVANVVREQSEALKNPPLSIADVLASLESAGVVQSVARLRSLIF